MNEPDTESPGTAPERRCFQRDKLIRFHHCDPAGIVFYPQYFVLFHELVEDWFNYGLELGYAEFVAKQRLGLPMVHIDCDFLSPGKIGDTLQLSLAVKRIGRSSLRLLIEANVKAIPTVRATLTVVLVRVDSLRPVPITPDLRSRIEAFVAS